MTIIADDKLHKYLLKKLKRAINNDQSILHISNKQEQITEAFAKENFYCKQEDFSGIDLNKAAFSQIILDLDMQALDDFEACITLCKRIAFKHANIMIIASNLCSFKNKINFIFENPLENFSRPNRAVTKGYLRNKVIELGLSLKNRAWQYDEKLLVIASND